MSETPTHLTKPRGVTARLLAWHTSLDVAAYRIDGKKELVIKGCIVSRSHEFVQPEMTVAMLSGMSIVQAKAHVQRVWKLRL